MSKKDKKQECPNPLCEYRFKFVCTKYRDLKDCPSLNVLKHNKGPIIEYLKNHNFEEEV